MKATEHHRMEEQIVKRQEYIAEQVEKLLACKDADDVKFFSYTEKITKRYVTGFAAKLADHLSDIDGGSELFVLQCLLAVGRGDAEQAALIYDKYLRDGINSFAEKLILETLE